MTTTDWTVVAAGVAIIGWINWDFFLARQRAVRAISTGGVQEVRVVVEGGYQPSDIRVSAGTPVRLLFDRREASPCSEEVVLPDFGIKRFLPARRTTVVEFTPAGPGTFDFSCGMGMLRGRLTVEPVEAN
jgi:plastocyanin domain-containing protein